MAKIFRKTDKIKVRVGNESDNLVLVLSPLDYQQKNEIQSMLLEAQNKNEPTRYVDGIRLAIKYSVKGVENCVDGDGNKYVPAFENGLLTDECVDDLMNMDLSDKVMMVCANLARGVPSKFLDQQNKELPDVEILGDKSSKK
jgi:hypothetical protein